MHLIFIPAFAIHDCEAYYNLFCVRVGAGHTIQFLSIDGYTHSGQQCLGDLPLASVVDGCVEECDRSNQPYLLIGHSTGALIVQQMYRKLDKKPVAVILFNPLIRHPRLWLCRRIPLFVFVMRLLDLIPVPLITHIHSREQFGTRSDVAPAMKYRLWIDLVTHSNPTISSLPPATTTVIMSSCDGIGTGGEDLACDNQHLTKYPGHASFRSLECMSQVLAILRKYDTTDHQFENLYRSDT